MSQYQKALSNTHTAVTNVQSLFVSTEGFASISVQIATADTFIIRLSWSNDGVTEFSGTNYTVSSAYPNISSNVLARFVSYVVNVGSAVTFTTSTLFIKPINRPKRVTAMFFSPYNGVVYSVVPPMYYSLILSLQTGLYGPIENNEIPMPVAGYFKNFVFNAVSASGSMTRTFTLMVNEVATSSFVIPINTNTVTNKSTVIKVNAGDRVVWRVTCNNSNGPDSYMSINFLFYHEEIPY